jgi:hypothetical protein
LTYNGPVEIAVSRTEEGFIAEGDILIHQDQIVGAARGAGVLFGRLWPNATIPYMLDDSISVVKREHIQGAIDHWNSETVVRLVSTSPTEGHPCGVDYEDCVLFTKGKRCTSHVGRVGTGRQNITVADGSHCDKSGIIHEIGHAAGLFHEHSSENRDRYVTIHEDNIKDKDFYYVNFTEQGLGGLDYTPYDYLSIMHYSAFLTNKDAVDPNMPVITRNDNGDNYVLGMQKDLSTFDKMTIDSMYGPFAFSYRNELVGRYCISVNEPADPHTWADNYFCAQKPGAKWFVAGRSTDSGLRCTHILEPADPDTWDDNYLCVPKDWPEQFSWSYSGVPAGKRCIAFYEPSDLEHTWSDNFLCWATYVPISVRFSDVDDDAYIWHAHEGKQKDSLCSAYYGDGKVGAATCDLTEIMKGRGLSGTQRFVIKFGNGYGGDRQGYAEIVSGNNILWSKRKLPVHGNTHYGWFYSVDLDIDFENGTVTVIDEY